MVVEKKLYTVDEFEAFAALPENRDLNLELINGEIIEKAMPTELHGYLIFTLNLLLGDFWRKHKHGRFTNDARFRFPSDIQNARQPDISFYADVSRPIVTKGSVPLTPDLVIEVKSPDDTYKLMREKAAYYLSVGAQLVWLFFAEKKMVEVYTSTGKVTLTETDTLTGGAVLSGFETPLKAYFSV